MKSQIIYKNKYKKGFLIFEIMISFTLSILFTISTIALSFTNIYLRQKGIELIYSSKININSIENFISSNIYSTSTPSFKYHFGNFSNKYSFGFFDILIPDLINSIGRDSCYPRFNFISNNITFHSPINILPQGNNSMDMEVRNGFIYLTADSNQTGQPDLYILNAVDPDNINIVSSINTGPGLGGIEIASHYIYALNLGTSYSLAIIDISDRAYPSIIKKYKIPVPNASTTLPIPSSIFYRNNIVYIGTEKWSGNEFNIIDVSDKNNPIYLGGYETNSLVEDIYISGDYAYIGTPGQKQFRVLNISDPKDIYEVSSFSYSGFATQEGKVVSLFEDNFIFGRTVGGFNVLQNHEIFSYSSSSFPLINNQTIPKASSDIPGGVYGIIYRYPFIYLATGQIGQEFQVWNEDLKNKIFSKDIGSFARNIICDNKDLYITTHDNRGVFIIKDLSI
jgi:hypothetical protein